jgi:hypothetical protein
MRKLLAFTIIFLSLSIISAKAQPPPIDLGIQNILQETPVWCWAAVAQQIIQKVRGQSPRQCQLVATARNAPPQYCCQSPTPCMTMGTLSEIQHLILLYGGHYSDIALPANPIIIYNTLRQDKGIIMQVRSSPGANHVVVIRGMAWAPNPILFINDPTSFFTSPVPFSDIAQYWIAAIVVY